MKNRLNNFKFLNKYDPRLYHLIDLAKGYPKGDPHASLIRLRQFGELLARLWASKLHLFPEEDELYSDFLDRIKQNGTIDPKVYEGLNHLRIIGNNALHGFQGDSKGVAYALKIANNLANLFRATFFDSSKEVKNLPKTISRKLEEDNPKTEKQIIKTSPQSEDHIIKDLSGHDFSRQDLRGRDFTGANLIKARFCNSNLDQVSFKGADLRGANFKGARNLHSNQLESSLKEGAIFPEELQRVLDSTK